LTEEPFEHAGSAGADDDQLGFVVFRDRDDCFLGVAFRADELPILGLAPEQAAHEGLLGLRVAPAVERVARSARSRGSDEERLDADDDDPGATLVGTLGRPLQRAAAEHAAVVGDNDRRHLHNCASVLFVRVLRFTCASGHGWSRRK
jgi:hypothetical protein